jgi:phosphate:Na+ symporter
VDSTVIATFQTLFNLITAVMLLPFTNLLVKLSVLVVKDEKKKEQRHPQLHTLDEHLYISPAVAVEEGTKAVASMGQIALANFAKGCAQLASYDESQLPDIEADEDCLDQFADRSDRFLIGLSKVVETEEDDRQVDMLLQVVPNFERVGDYAINLLELSQRLVAANSAFSDTAKRELEIIGGAVNEILNITVTAFTNNDNVAAKAIEPLEETIDDMVMILRDRHTKRLKSGACNVDTGLVFMEALTYLERAADHCSSIAVLMLGRHDESILMNHYDYIRDLHKGADESYQFQRNRRREQYVKPLKEIQ